MSSRVVRPPSLPRFPRPAVCPACGRDGEADGMVLSYVAPGADEDAERWVGCGHCLFNGPADCPPEAARRIAASRRGERRPR